MTTTREQLEHCTERPYTVAGGQTTTAGMGVILASDTTIQTAGAGSDAAIGVARQTCTAGQICNVSMFGPIKRVLVGTGGATRGAKVQIVADGFTDAPAPAAGATSTPIYGVWLETGVAGDIRAMMLSGVGNRESA